MKGYFDQSQLIQYMNLCYLIQEESKKIHKDSVAADLTASISIAKSEGVGIGRLLIDKGIITPEEYTMSLIDGLQTTLESIRHLSGEKQERTNNIKKLLGG
jgi:Membrane-bound lytic murein transglycosylase